MIKLEVDKSYLTVDDFICKIVYKYIKKNPSEGKPDCFYLGVVIDEINDRAGVTWLTESGIGINNGDDQQVIVKEL